MKTRKIYSLVAFLMVSGLFIGCQTNTHQHSEGEHDMHASHPQHHGPDITEAKCVLHPTSGNSVEGVVVFKKTDDGILVSVKATGLTEGKHGFHVHQLGDCSSPDGKSAGGHFNPHGTEHGAPNAQMRHVGDFGNIEADANGNVDYEFTDKEISFEGMNSVIGRSIVVHAGEDDLHSQPTGNAGARVACGVIGISGLAN